MRNSEDWGKRRVEVLGFDVLERALKAVDIVGEQFSLSAAASALPVFRALTCCHGGELFTGCPLWLTTYGLHTMKQDLLVVHRYGFATKNKRIFFSSVPQS